MEAKLTFEIDISSNSKPHIVARDLRIGMTCGTFEALQSAFEDILSSQLSNLVQSTFEVAKETAQNLPAVPPSVKAKKAVTDKPITNVKKKAKAVPAIEK